MFVDYAEIQVIGGTGGLDKRDTGMLELTALNTYTGPTTINSAQGGLVVTELANGGVPSNIGASTSDAANLHIRTNGALRYIGPGVTTDRLFTIGNATLDASGAGPLVFADSGTMGTSGGNRTLTLTGANMQDNALAAARKLLEGEGMPVNAAMRVGSSGQAIAEYAKELPCDQIVMGTRGLGRIGSLVLGSVATQVVHLADYPVTLIK